MYVTNVLLCTEYLSWVSVRKTSNLEHARWPLADFAELQQRGPSRVSRCLKWIETLRMTKD